MVSRYISPDLGPAYRLKTLLGEKWNMLNPGEHPLGSGRLALDKYLVTPLSEPEKFAMADLKRWAEIIDKTKDTWQPNEGRFVKDLLTASKCRSLLFEIEVIIGCVDATVHAYEWPIYREGERDIQATGPSMVIECKITDSPAIRRVLKRTSKARRQSRPRNTPLVAAIGFDRRLNTDEVMTVTDEIRARQTWFIERPDLAAALILMRKAPGSSGYEWNPLGFKGTTAFEGEMLEIRNHASQDSLPDTFSFGGREGLERIRRLRGPAGSVAGA